MEQFELLRHVVGVLEGLGIPYFVTGSTATIFYGEPRFTNDIDIVADLPPGKIQAFCDAFPAADYYISDAAVRQAVADRGQFNIIHPASGLKIDMIVPTRTPFERGRFARAIRVSPAEGMEALFSSPEDVIIKKMEFFRQGGSEKHLRDIAGILKVNGGSLDREYISHWSSEIGLTDIWQLIRSQVE